MYCNLLKKDFNNILLEYCVASSNRLKRTKNARNRARK